MNKQINEAMSFRFPEVYTEQPGLEPLPRTYSELCLCICLNDFLKSLTPNSAQVH